MSSRLDFSIWRDTNAPSVSWQFPDDFDLTGSTLVLAILDQLNKPVLTIDSASDASLTVDIDAHSVTWAYTIEQSNDVPRGPSSTYTLERHLDGGEQRVVAQGRINVNTHGGIIDTVADPTVLLVVTGPQGPPGPGVTTAQSIALSLIFG